VQWLPHFQFQSMYIDPNQDWIKEYSINIVQLSIQASTGTVCQVLHCILTIGVHHRATGIADLHYRITWYSCIGGRVHGIALEKVWRVWTAWYKGSCSYDRDGKHTFCFVLWWSILSVNIIWTNLRIPDDSGEPKAVKRLGASLCVH